MHCRSNMLNLRLELFDGVPAQACVGFYPQLPARKR